MVDFLSPLKKGEKTKGAILVPEPVCTQHEWRLEMKQEALNSASHSRLAYPPCPAFSFSPDDGSLASTLTTSTTKSIPDILDHDDIFAFPEDVVSKMNVVQPEHTPRDHVSDKKRVFPAFPFEETMDKIFFRMFDAIFGDEAMMVACKDPMLGKPILNDGLSTDGDPEGMVELQQNYGDEISNPSPGQAMFVSHATDNENSNFFLHSGPALYSESIAFVTEDNQRDTTSMSNEQNTTSVSHREIGSFFPSFQSSSLSVDGYSTSIELDGAEEKCTMDQDDSSWGRPHQAVSDQFIHSTRRLVLQPGSSSESVELNDAGFILADSNLTDTLYSAIDAENAPENDAVEISTFDEDFDNEPWWDSDDELIFIKANVFEPVDECKVKFVRHEEEEIVFESENEDFQDRENHPQEVNSIETLQHSTKKSASKRPLGLRFLFGPRLRRRFSRFSWNMNHMRHGMHNSSKSKTKEDPSRSQSSPGTVATTTFTIPSDSDTIQDLSIPTSTRRSEAYDEQDSCGYHHDYHQQTVITIHSR